MKTHCIATLLFLSGAVAAGQTYTPFEAKVRTVHYNVAADGTKTLTGVIVGMFYRAPDGTTLLRTHSVTNGQVGAETGVLTGPDGSVTRLLYKTHQAIRVQDGSGSSYQRPFSTAAGPRQTMNGVSCIVKPVSNIGCTNPKCQPGSAPGDANTVCGSPEYGVPVHADSFYVWAGVTTETVQDTYDFVHKDPDPALMRVPPDFSQKRQIKGPPG